MTFTPLNFSRFANPNGGRGSFDSSCWGSICKIKRDYIPAPWKPLNVLHVPLPLSFPNSSSNYQLFLRSIICFLIQIQRAIFVERSARCHFSANHVDWIYLHVYSLFSCFFTSVIQYRLISFYNFCPCPYRDRFCWHWQLNWRQKAKLRIIGSLRVFILRI